MSEVTASRFRALVAAVGIAFASQGVAEERRFVGMAYDAKTELKLYEERHAQEWQDGELLDHRVDYIAPNGELFATKTVNYRPSRMAPEFRLEDSRLGLEEGLRYADRELTLFFRRNAEEDLRTATFSADEPFVADAGFHQTVLDNWEGLLAGDEVLARVLVPSQGKWFNFKLKHTGDTDERGTACETFQMQPASMLLRVLAEPVQLTYRAKDRTLMRYEGVSNIRTPDGKRQYRARVEFPDNQMQAVAE